MTNETVFTPLGDEPLRKGDWVKAAALSRDRAVFLITVDEAKKIGNNRYWFSCALVPSMTHKELVRRQARFYRSPNEGRPHPVKAVSRSGVITEGEVDMAKKSKAKTKAAKAKAVPAKTETTKAPEALAVFKPNQKITIKVDKNPLPKGASPRRARFDLMKTGMTCQQLIDAGGTENDLFRSVKRGWITVG